MWYRNNDGSATVPAASVLAIYAGYFIGVVIIASTGAALCQAFLVGGNGTITAMTVNASWTTTKDNESAPDTPSVTANVYYEGGVLKVQNNFAAGKVFSWTFLASDAR